MIFCEVHASINAVGRMRAFVGAKWEGSSMQFAEFRIRRYGCRCMHNLLNCWHTRIQQPDFRLPFPQCKGMGYAAKENDYAMR